MRREQGTGALRGSAPGTCQALSGLSPAPACRAWGLSAGLKEMRLITDLRRWGCQQTTKPRIANLQMTGVNFLKDVAACGTERVGVVSWGGEERRSFFSSVDRTLHTVGTWEIMMLFAQTTCLCFVNT